MKIYNTLSKSEEEFVPYNGNEVKMYTCGPTVYHYAHIGNLRTYIFEDILEKSLNYLGYHVKRVMNITDVGHLQSDADTGEDKMLLGAKREHKTVYEIAKFYTDAFFSDTKKLNIKTPEVVSKASDNIDMYIKMIQKLLDTGYAYISGNNVYFDISKAKDYYKLSGKNEQELIIGARDDVDHDDAKKNPYDFALWFTKSKFENQEMKWDSPFGVGYPGWHIECSGISIKYLGEHLDIHCGGVDNIFPHHTNEIAQSECYLGHKWCNYWVHFGFLNDKNGKMSKSKGEFLTVSVLEEKGYNPLAYRYLCLNSYYHNALTFSYEILDGAEREYLKLKNKVLSLKEDGEIDTDKLNSYDNKFKEALNNNLNTSMCLTILYDVLKDNSINESTKISLVQKFDTVLSLDLLKENNVVVDKELERKVNELIEKRNSLKKEKRYEEADKVRDEIKALGAEIKDTREGVVIIWE